MGRNATAAAAACDASPQYSKTTSAWRASIRRTTSATSLWSSTSSTRCTGTDGATASLMVAAIRWEGREGKTTPLKTAHFRACPQAPSATTPSATTPSGRFSPGESAAGRRRSSDPRAAALFERVRPETRAGEGTRTSGTRGGVGGFVPAQPLFRQETRPKRIGSPPRMPSARVGVRLSRRGMGRRSGELREPRHEQSDQGPRRRQHVERHEPGDVEPHRHATPLQDSQGGQERGGKGSQPPCGAESRDGKRKSGVVCVDHDRAAIDRSREPPGQDQFGDVPVSRVRILSVP